MAAFLNDFKLRKTLRITAPGRFRLLHRFQLKAYLRNRKCQINSNFLVNESAQVWAAAG